MIRPEPWIRVHGSGATPNRPLLVLTGSFPLAATHHKAASTSSRKGRVNDFDKQRVSTASHNVDYLDYLSHDWEKDGTTALLPQFGRETKRQPQPHSKFPKGSRSRKRPQTGHCI